MTLRTGLIGVLVAIAVVAGLAFFYRDFIQISLLVDRNLRGAMWSAVVRHTTTFQGQPIYCYDEGSQFCENVLAKLTNNNQLRFSRSRTLGYAFSPGLDLGSVPHHTLYSCVNLKDARAGTYTYRITTDPKDCQDIGGYPYPLGKVFTQPGDVEVPLPLHRNGALLSTDNAIDNEFLLGYLSAVQIHQTVDGTPVGPRPHEIASFCVQRGAHCLAGNSDALCQQSTGLCTTEPPLEDRQRYDINQSGCVGEIDVATIQAEVGTDAAGVNRSSDVNSDGVIDSLDVMAVTRFIDNPANQAAICTPANEGLMSVQRPEVVVE